MTVCSSGVLIDSTPVVYPVKSRPSSPSVSSDHLTSADVIGSPSDHFASSIRWKVTVRPSSETSHDSAIAGAGARSSGSKPTSSSQLIAQIVNSSSFTPTNGLSVLGSCDQPILRTSLDPLSEPESSCAVAPVDTANTTEEPRIAANVPNFASLITVNSPCSECS